MPALRTLEAERGPVESPTGPRCAVRSGRVGGRRRQEPDPAATGTVLVGDGLEGRVRGLLAGAGGEPAHGVDLARQARPGVLRVRQGPVDALVADDGPDLGL